MLCCWVNVDAVCVWVMGIRLIGSYSLCVSGLCGGLWEMLIVVGDNQRVGGG